MVCRVDLSPEEGELNSTRQLYAEQRSTSFGQFKHDFASPHRECEPPALAIWVVLLCTFSSSGISFSR